MDVDIHSVPQTQTQAEAGEPTALLCAYSDVERELLLEQWGHDDFWAPPAELQRVTADDAWMERWRCVALPVGADPATVDSARALGTAAVFLPRRDNTHLALAELGVRPGQRRRGVGAALAAAVADHIRAAGRTTVSTWVAGPPPADDDAAALVPRTGVGRADGATPAAAWLRRRGFELEQVERASTLHIPAGGAPRDAWLRRTTAAQAAAAAAAGPDYELLTWSGATPPEHRAGMAALHARMSVDAPSADLDFEEEAWDAARVVNLDERLARMGRDRCLAVARHVPSGDLVAYTELQWARTHPVGVVQEDTLVHGDHRGHRLGMLVKAANLLRLVEANPAAARVHTWNAGENDHMLAINTALGFELQRVEGVWQKRL